MEIQNNHAGVVILLTGCVDAKNMSYTALTDISVREKHYIDSMQFYYKETAIPIILAENSNHTFSADLVTNLVESGRVEILTYDGNNFDKHLGKGYGEMETLLFTMKHSKFIGPNTRIIKITGRHQVYNINTYIHKINLKDQFLYFKGHPKAASEIYVTSRYFINNFLGRNINLINDTAGVFFEHVLAISILEASAKGHRYEMLCSYPRLVGIRGTENIPHRTNSKLFWIRQNLLYQIVSSVFNKIDRLIQRYFQG